MELRKVKNQRINKRYSILIIMGISLLFLSTTYFVYNYYQRKQLNNIDNQKIEEFFDNEYIEDETIEEIEEKQPVVKERVVKYIGILEIPKINLKKGIVDKNSSDNNVNKNIYMIKETTLPDEQINSHIILVAHSGNSYISYFKNLKKLDMKDTIYFYYKEVKYIYEVSNKYEIEKTGTTELKQTNISNITLITCISGTNKQVVYVATLVGYENY